jgi:hypothetical protein
MSPSINDGCVGISMFDVVFNFGKVDKEKMGFVLDRCIF